MARPDIDSMHSLKVDNLTYRTHADELRPMFEKYGEIGDIYIPRNRQTGESRGFAFVRFIDLKDAEDAMDALDGKLIDGRDMRVQLARYNRPDPVARFGGGRDRDHDRRDYDRRDRDRFSDRRDRDYDRRSDRSRRSRSRSYDRSRRSRSRSNDRSRRSRSRSNDRRHSRSRSNDRRRSRSRSNDRRRSRSRSKDRRRSRSKSASRSPAPKEESPTKSDGDARPDDDVEKKLDADENRD